MLRSFFRWLFSTPPPRAPIVEAREIAPRESYFSTEIGVDDRLSAAERLAQLNRRIFQKTVADTAVMVDPAQSRELATFAQDSSDGSSSVKSIFALNQVGIPEVQAYWYGSQGFIGYQLCAVIAQHWLVTKACLVPARDAIRKGYKITVNDGSHITPKILGAIDKANKKFKLNRALVRYVQMGRVYGVRVAFCVIDSADPDYYVKPFNPDSIRPGSYRGISQVDPYWCIPELTSASASNPAALDFYEPTYWIINNQRFHKSHLVILRGPEVGDVLKPSYLYGGVSIPQRIYERVYAAERTANEAPQLTLTKRAMVFYTDAAKALANQQLFEQRLQTWAAFRDNYGVKVADKEADTIEQHETSLSGLDEAIMTQYQLVAAAANVPATKLLGTSPKGFNATGEHEADSYHEELESIQVNDLEPLIDRHLVCLIRSEIAPKFDIAPFEVSCTWEKLDSLGEKEAAEVNKVKAETDKIYAVDIGAIDAHEVRKRVSAEENSGYNGLPELTNVEENPTDPQA